MGDHGILFSHGPRLQVFKLSWQVDCWIIMSGTTGPCERPIAEGRDRPWRETDRGSLVASGSPSFMIGRAFLTLHGLNSFCVRMLCGPEIPEGVRDFGLARNV